MRTFIAQNQKSLIILALIVLGSFLVSSNMAWLNPRPGYKVHKMPEKIPFMWQYNHDSGSEICSAAFFPDYFRKNPLRVNRPAYPFCVWAISKVIYLITCPFASLSKLQLAGIAYMFFKLFVYYMGALLMFLLVRRYFDERTALLSTALAFFQYFSIKFAAAFHTCELQFITPIIIIFLFRQLTDSYSHTKNILFSLLAGFLMLGKTNYAAYIAVILFAVAHFRIKESILSVLVHFIPLLLWLAVLKLLGIEYSSLGVDKFEQGSWLYRHFIFMPPLKIYKITAHITSSYISVLAVQFSVWLFMAFVSAGILLKEKCPKYMKILFFSFLFLLASWFQVFAANRPRAYMTADLSIIVFPLAVFLIFRLLESIPFRLTEKTKNVFAVSLALLWFIPNILLFVNLPWVHPYYQPSFHDAAFYEHAENPGRTENGDEDL